MTESATQYGRVGALALVVGGIVFSVGVIGQDVGANPSAMAQGAGYLGIALFVVGMAALLAMMFSIYGDEDV